MIRIDHCNLRMPGQSEADARAVVAELRRLLAERVGAGLDDSFTSRLDLRVEATPEDNPRTLAAKIADALLSAVGPKEAK